MFEKLAKFRHLGLRRIAPGTGVIVYSNDNLPGFRRPTGRRLRPKLAPTCHWDLTDGRLECCWQFETSDEPPVGGLEQNATGRCSGSAFALKARAIA